MEERCLKSDDFVHKLSEKLLGYLLFAADFSTSACNTQVFQFK